MQTHLAIASAAIARLRERGITITLRNNRLWVRPAHIYAELSEAEKTTLREHREEIKALVRADLTDEPESPPPPPAPPRKKHPHEDEPTPVVFAYGHQVTKHDVRDALYCLGDAAVADYDSGRMSKAEAYEIARRRLREYQQIRSGAAFSRPQ